MKRTITVALAFALLHSPLYARYSSGSHRHRSASSRGRYVRSHRSYHARSRSHSTRSYSGVRINSRHRNPRTFAPVPHARDQQAGIKRSESAKRDFMRQTGYPHGRKGYVVDHIKPLACGGADGPSNMQWQTDAEAKAKDKVERKGCCK